MAEVFNLMFTNFIHVLILSPRGSNHVRDQLRIAREFFFRNWNFHEESDRFGENIDSFKLTNTIWTQV